MKHYFEKEAGELLSKHNLTLGVAESCTGGLISSMLTNVPGSSHYFIGGVIAYNNKIKLDILKVSAKTLKIYGAVSEKTAAEMARGIKDICCADIGLAVTGIAGPDGGTKEKPVGTVYIAMSTGKGITVKKFLFKGARIKIKTQAAENALQMIKNYLMEKYKG